MRKTRLFMCLLLVLFVSVSLAACSKGPKGENKEMVKEKVVFRITWKIYSGRGEAIQAIVNKYNLGNDKHEVEVVDGDEDLDHIRTAIGDGSVDIFVLPYRYVKLLGHEKILAPLNVLDYVKGGIINENLQEFGEIDDVVYGIPWVSHSMALIYNKNILDEFNLTDASIVDRDSFEQVLKTIDDHEGYSGIGLVGAEHNDLSWMVNQCLHGRGVTLIEGKTIKINTEAAVQAIEYYRDVLGSYAQDSWLEDTGYEVMNAFRQQEVAFEIQSIWGITDIWKNGSPFEVGVLPLDRIGLNSEVGPMLLAMGANLSIEKRQVLDDFISYMLSAEAQEAIMKGEYNPEKAEFYPFRLPVREDIFELESFNKYEIFKVFKEAYNYPSVDVPNPYWMLIKDSIYTPNLHKVMREEMTVGDFLNLIEKEGSKIIEEGTE